MPIVVLSTTSDIMRPDQDSCFSLAQCRAAHHAFNDPVAPFVDSVAFLPCTKPHVGQRDRRRKAKNEHACSSGSKKKPAEE